MAALTLKGVLAAWQGPVYDADDPYGDGETRDDLAAVKHVQQMLIIDGKDYQGIKEAVFKYGGVQTSLYSTIASSKTKTPYYNKQTNSYCYIGQNKPNHDVVIIGWDDNYPKENFNVDLEGDGAFICQNSWVRSCSYSPMLPLHMGTAPPSPPEISDRTVLPHSAYDLRH